MTTTIEREKEIADAEAALEAEMREWRLKPKPATEPQELYPLCPHCGKPLAVNIQF